MICRRCPGRQLASGTPCGNSAVHRLVLADKVERFSFWSLRRLEFLPDRRELFGLGLTDDPTRHRDLGRLVMRFLRLDLIRSIRCC